MTTVTSIIASIKKRIDYNITDTDLDSLLLDILNDGVTWLRQKLMDSGLRAHIGKTANFFGLAGEEYVDIRLARIVGDATTFTGIADDKLKVTIDGTAYDNISIATATSIANVVTAINAAVLTTVASVDSNGCLVIASTKTDGSGSVVIADGSTTAQTVVGDLFSQSRDRSVEGITDIDELLRVRDKDDDSVIDIYDFEDLVEQEPDENSSSNSTPYMVSRWQSPFYLFFRSELSESRRITIDYFPFQTELTSGSTLPFIRKYDPLLKQYCRVEFFAWKFADDPSNPQFVREEGKLEQLLNDMVVKCSKNFGKSRQTASRRDGTSAGPKYSNGLPIYES
jgi:hypothetical protein